MTEGGFFPNVCAIPRFDDLCDRQIVSVAANALVGRGPAQLSGGADRQRFLNLVRLTDRMVGDFQMASQALQSFVDRRSSGELSSLFLTVSYVESGCAAFARSLKFANALMRSNDAPDVASYELPAKSFQARVRKMRNAIEHYDERIAKGSVNFDDMPMLKIGDTDMQLLSIAITWLELDGGVRQIHALSSRLIAL